MKRSSFLKACTVIAVSVGSVALLAPEAFLASKGVTNNPAAAVWMRETGLLILASGLVAFLIRNHGDSATLRAVLVGNALVQFGLLAIEIFAHAAGVIPGIEGILPNSILHIALGICFAIYASSVHLRDGRREPSQS